MDPSSSPSLNQLGHYIMDAKIVEMVIKYCRLQKKKKLNTTKVKLKDSKICASKQIILMP